jgi:hypothetical protein
MQELHAIWTHCLVQLIHFSKPYYHPAYLKPLRYLFILSGIFSATPCIARDESSNSRSKRTVPCGFGTCVRRGSIRDNILLYSHAFGRIEVPWWRSKRTWKIFRRDSRMEQDRPTGPPPMIATGCVQGVVILPLPWSMYTNRSRDTRGKV